MFWEKVDKKKTTSSDMVVSAVDTEKETISVTSDPNCLSNSLYHIPASSYPTLSTGTPGQILYYSRGSSLSWSGPNTPTYIISTDEGELTLNEEEYKSCMKLVFEHITKIRKYKDEFEGLLK